jgi:ubiquinone/menaquinone biosynthesis C-methylase UbiE
MFDSRIKSFFRGKEIFVDIGCGSGDILDVLLGRYRTLIGLDRFETRLKNRGTRPRKWKFVQADLNQHFPLSSNSVDTAFANQAIEHILDPLHFVAEIYRILKPEGAAIITTPNIRYVKNLWRIIVNGFGPRTAGGNQIDGPWDDGHLHYFTHRDLREIFSEAGFFSVSSTGLVNLKNGAFTRRIADRYSAASMVREFFSGNILLIARK